MTVKSANTTPSTLEFWRRRLSGDLPESHFSPDRARSPVLVPAYESVTLQVAPDVAEKVAKDAKSRRAPAFAFLSAAVAALLVKYTRGAEIIFGTPARAEPREEAQRYNPPLALRLAVDRDQPFKALLAVVAETSSAAFDQQMNSLDAVFSVLGIEHDRTRFPLFDVAMRLERFSEPFDLKAYPIDVLFDFAIENGRVNGSLRYRADLYDQDRMERLAGHLANVLAAGVADRTRALAEIDVLTAEERRHLVAALNDNARKFRTDATFHGLFEAQAARTPDAPAVEFYEEVLTYRALNERANRLARRLVECGIGKGEFVAIQQHRNCNFLVAMLAVFKAGAAYVPVDPTYPADRIQYMLTDSQARAVITEADVALANGALLAQCDRLESVICQDRSLAPDALPQLGEAVKLFGRNNLDRLDGGDLGLEVRSRDRAYMIYTSGSTGRPKGAICRHDGALNHLFGELYGLGISEAFSFLQSAASSSDISVWQFLAPVLHGGTTVVVDHGTVTDPEWLFNVIRSRRLSLVELVPVVLRALVDHVAELPASERVLPDLRCMMATGEALPVDVVNRWFSLYPEIPIANTYGPTEASDDITLFVTKKPLPAGRRIVPIGVPMPNLNIFILDPNLALVPFGVPGEICVSGIGVGEGYWNQPEKTAAAFVPNPVAGAAGETIYRTGDLGRWLPDGSVEFLGRIDQQVKIRGFRIEPGEVQTALLAHPAIGEAVVVSKPDAVGNNRLVAYYETVAGKSVTGRELRAFLAESLADYMIPAAFVAVQRMPLTPVGKIDRKALPDVAPYELERSKTYVAPSTRTEAALAKIWSKLLGIPEVGIHDDFMELGGNSILSINIAASAKAAGISMRPAALFVHPTIAALAATCDARAAEVGITMPGSEGQAPFSLLDLEPSALDKLKARFSGAEDAYSLSPTQTGIYLQGLLSGKRTGVYIEQIVLTLDGELDLAAFTDAWRAVIARYPVLRTAINRRGTPQPVQVVLSEVPFEIVFHDWRGRKEGVIDAEYDALVKAERVAGFDLSQPPLMRVMVVRTRDDGHRLLWTYHHIILDGWSEPIVIENVFKAYAAIRRGAAPAVVEPPRYRRFIEWVARSDPKAGEEFWRAELSGFRQPITIPMSDPAPTDGGNLSHGWIEVALSPEDTKACNALALKLRVTMSTLLQGIWALVLARYSGSRDIVYGSAVSGRQIDLDGVENIPGPLIATLPVRVAIAEESPLAAWLCALQRKTVEIRQFEHFPLPALQDMTEVPTQFLPIFDTIFVMANYPGNDLAADLAGIVLISKVEYVTMPHYPVTLFVVPEERMKVRLVFDRGRYAADLVMAALELYRSAILQALHNLDQPVGTFLAAMRPR